jgi:hypothetical protein
LQNSARFASVSVKIVQASMDKGAKRNMSKANPKLIEGILSGNPKGLFIRLFRSYLGDSSTLGAAHPNRMVWRRLSPPQHLAVQRSLIPGRVELHREKGVVADDSGHVHYSLCAEARLGALERRVGDLFVLQ